MLTHEHGVKLVEKYTHIEKVYVYPYKDGFNVKNRVDELSNKSFDVVVVPVTNINGGGFFYVLKFSKSINVKERAMCNVISDINTFSMTYVYWLEIKNFFMKVISILGTIIISPVVLILLLLKLKSIE